MKSQLSMVHEDRALAEMEKQGLKQLLHQKEACQWTLQSLCPHLIFLLLCRNGLRSALLSRRSWTVFSMTIRPILRPLIRIFAI